VDVRYVDGFVVPVPRNRLDEYKKMARRFKRICKDHGAVEYVECVADGIKNGKVTSFPKAVQLKPNETVVFSWIGFKTKAHRDRVMAKVMDDPRMKEMMDPEKMPFDGMRMFWGSFDVMVKL
jgi:uncharacterized protein YbaA (DUF1428 family)